MVLESSDTEDEHSSVDAGVPRTPFNTPVEGTNNSSTVLSAKQLEVYSWFLYWFSGFPLAMENLGKWDKFFELGISKGNFKIPPQSQENLVSQGKLDQKIIFKIHSFTGD